MKERRSFDALAGRISYTDEGDGPTVVLLHGFPQSSFVWRHAIPMLVSRFRVVTPDLLGAGDSDRPAGADLGLEAQARYLDELLTDIGVDRFAVIGQGEGGGVAQILALDRPGADAMVLLASAAFEAWPAPAVSALAADELRDAASWVREHLRAGMADPDRLPPADLDRYVEPWEGPDASTTIVRIARRLDATGSAGREAELASLEIPVLIFWGEEDPYFPASVAERLNDAIPTSTLGLLPGCGHFLMDEAPETLVPMIFEYLRARFLHAPHGAHGGHEGIVTIQLERKPPWVEMAEVLDDDDDEGDDG
jgi:pimeloyl-ACP methyl ester carboxylesterase